MAKNTRNTSKANISGPNTVRQTAGQTDQRKTAFQKLRDKSGSGIAYTTVILLFALSVFAWQNLKHIESDSWLPEIVLAFGAIVSILLGYITHLQRTASERQQNMARFGRILDQSTNEIYLFDSTTLEFISANEGARKNLGYSSAELAKMHPFDIKPEYDEKKFREMIDPLANGSVNKLRFETIHKRKDGSTYPVDVNLQIAHDLGPPTFVAIIQDISEQKLHEYERRLYTTIIENTLDLIAIVNPKTGKFSFVNNGACKALGYTNSELMKFGPDDLRKADNPDEIQSKTDQILSGELDHALFDMQYKRKDGRYIDIEVQLLRVFNSLGEVALLGIGRDISERKKNEEELLKARAELERKAADLMRSNNELQQFAYAASHDLQEPLRMISAYLQLLEEEYADKLNDEAREYIHFAVDGANRMRDLVLDLLAFSQIETAGRAFKTVDTMKVIDTALQNLSEPINESGVMIRYDNDMPNIYGDFGQIVQLFTNLIGNAIKYRSKENPEVQIVASSNENTCKFSIIDNGIGINKRHHKKIFEIFKRLHTQDEYSGTGIGLALCKRIIERHGGTIGVKSNPEGGSTFYFTLSNDSPRRPQKRPNTTDVSDDTVPARTKDRDKAA